MHYVYATGQLILLRERGWKKEVGALFPTDLFQYQLLPEDLRASLVRYDGVCFLVPGPWEDF